MLNNFKNRHLFIFNVNMAKCITIKIKMNLHINGYSLPYMLCSCFHGYKPNKQWVIVICAKIPYHLFPFSRVTVALTSLFSLFLFHAAFYFCSVKTAYMADVSKGKHHHSPSTPTHLQGNIHKWETGSNHPFLHTDCFTVWLICEECSGLDCWSY